jgi:plasmid stability protein
MGQVIVRQLDDAVIEAHRCKARARGVSLEQELREAAIVPELILAEVLSAGWKSVRLGLMTKARLQAMAAELPLCFVKLTELQTFAASRIAVEIDPRSTTTSIWPCPSGRLWR